MVSVIYDNQFGFHSISASIPRSISALIYRFLDRSLIEFNCISIHFEFIIQNWKSCRLVHHLPSSAAALKRYGNNPLTRRISCSLIKNIIPCDSILRRRCFCYLNIQRLFTYFSLSYYSYALLAPHRINLIITLTTSVFNKFPRQTQICETNERIEERFLRLLFSYEALDSSTNTTHCELL